MTHPPEMAAVGSSTRLTGRSGTAVPNIIVSRFGCADAVDRPLGTNP